MVFDSFQCWKSITSFGAFQPVLVFAGYAAGGLTQPTGTIMGYGYGNKALAKLNPAMENKTYANKVGWDKRSVPNMFVKEH